MSHTRRREVCSRVTAFHLGPKAAAAGYRLVAQDRVGSTNDEAGAAARSGDPGNVWFAALQQTAGRGRRGRQWETPFGNLAASLLLFPKADAAVSATLGFVAGVALNRALGEVLPDARFKTGIDGADGRTPGAPARIALKWPNDVLADGAKLAGILLEAQTLPASGGQAVIIGFGVNVVAAPQGLPYPAVSVAELGSPIDAQTILAALAEHWTGAYTVWAGGRGIAEILAEWRRSAAGIGAPVAIQTYGETLRGIFETIDEAGRLVVRTAEGRRVPVAAGDVHFGTTASVR